MTSHDYEQANARLALISARDPASKPITQVDVENIMWAVQELDNRNRDLRNALETDPNVTLTNEDVRGLENSVHNIRDMYQWMLAGNNGATKSPVRTITTAPAVVAPAPPVIDTLKSVSADTGVAVNELRLLNPQLEELGANEPIPENMQIRIPPQVVQKTALRSSASNSRRSSPARIHRQSYTEEEDDDMTTTSSTSARWRVREREMRRRRAEEAMPDKLIENEITLASLSTECRMTIEEILHQNPNLESYDTHEVIPFHEPVEIRRQELRTDDDDDRNSSNVPRKKSLYRDGPLASASRRKFGRQRQDAVKNQETDRLTVTRGDSLYDIAHHLCRCPIEDVRDLNPELDDFGDRDILPTGAEIYIPANYNNELRQNRDHEQNYAGRAPSRGASPSRGESNEDSVEVGSRDVHGAQTLQELSEELDFPIEAIRDANPAAARFADDQPLPRRMLLSVPHDSARNYFGGRSKKSPGRARTTQSPSRATRTVEPSTMYSRSGGSSFASKRRIESESEIYVSKAGDTLDALAHKWQCHPDELVDGTPELNQYHDHDPLPKGITIMLPASLPPPGDHHGSRTYYSTSVVRY